MLYPNYLKKGDGIGITAPSDGNKKETDFIRLENGKKKLQDRGYHVIETASVRGSNKGRSNTKEIRGKEFMELIENRDISYIVSAKGGDFLMEMLSYIDYDKIKANPKWFQGYSDNTGLIHTITTKCDMATLYGANFNEYGMGEWHKAVQNSMDLVEGNLTVQESFDLYEDGYYDKVTGLEGYVLEKQVYWKNVRNSGTSFMKEETTMSGIMLGGCLDVLLNLVGTRFDSTVSFIEKYKEQGIIWYLESFALDSESITRGLWQLKEAGWFQYAKGFIFGRPMFFDHEYYISYEESVLTALGDYNVPIILDADIGHKAPQMTIINGGLATITCKDGKGSIEFHVSCQ